MSDPDYTVVVPAFNEEAFLPRTLEALVAAVGTVSPHRGEIVVVDNNSTDRTAAVAAAHGVRVVFEPVNQISRARNCGAAASRGRYLLFVDADTVVSAELITAALAALDSGRVCGGGTVVGSTDRAQDWMHRSFRYWNWLSKRCLWAAGCFVYCRREAWEAVGGFSQEYYASEEIHFSKAVRRWGRRHGQAFRILDVPADTSLRKARWFSLGQMVWFVLKTVLWPWRLRSRRACYLWYQRPAAAKTAPAADGPPPPPPPA